MFRLIFLAVTQALLMCTCQSLFKVASEKMPSFSLSRAFFRDGIFLNWTLALSGICAIAMMVEWGYMVRNYPFHQVYPLTSLSFLFAMFVSIIFFKETVEWQQWVGVFLILGGCFLIAK
jgi:undecaprenyl phosphate-alpha-L-ara4N flippase subunit ArnE